MGIKIPTVFLYFWLVVGYSLTVSTSTEFQKGEQCQLYNSERREFSTFPFYGGIKPLGEHWYYIVEFNNKLDRSNDFLLNVTSAQTFQADLYTGTYSDSRVPLNWTKDLFPTGNWSHILFYESNGSLIQSHRGTSSQISLYHRVNMVMNQEVQVLIKTSGAEFQVNCNEGCYIEPLTGRLDTSYATVSADFELQAVTPPAGINAGGGNYLSVNDLKWIRFSNLFEKLNQSSNLNLNGLFLMKNCTEQTTTEQTPDETQQTFYFVYVIVIPVVAFLVTFGITVTVYKLCRRTKETSAPQGPPMDYQVTMQSSEEVGLDDAVY